MKFRAGLGLLCAALLTLSVVLALPAQAAADWPMFKHDAARSGSVARPAITSPRLLWKVPIGIAGWLNSPVIADDTVFVGTGGSYWNEPDYQAATDSLATDGVYAFDLSTGARKWHAAADNDVNNVVWADHKVIATGDEAAIWALDPRTGEQLWRTELKGIGFQLLPLSTAAGEQVIVGDSEGQLSWVDARSGKIMQSAQLDGSIRAGAASDGKLVLTATTEGTVYAFDVRSGRLKWKQRLRDLYPEYADSEIPLEIYGALTIVKNNVVVGFARDTAYETPALLALDISSGRLRWKASAGSDNDSFGNIRTSPALYKSRLIYAEPYSNRIVALDAGDGRLKSSLSAGLAMFPQWSSPAIAGDTAYVPRFDGGLYALNAADGELRWEFYLGIPNLAGPTLPDALRDTDTYWKPPIGDSIYASPALAADGRILIPAAGYLFCIGED